MSIDLSRWVSRRLMSAASRKGRSNRSLLTPPLTPQSTPRSMSRPSLLEMLEGRTLLAAAPTFEFTLDAAQKTSAGIFKEDGTLVRTLWSGVDYPIGTHTKSWDGLDDFGNRVADDDYKVRVISNNVTYVWDGVIGNTSDSYTAADIWRGYDQVGALASSGTSIYYGNGYAESGGSSGRFASSDPNGGRTQIGVKSGDTFLTVTDDNNVYWTSQDVFQATDNTYIWASTVSNDSFYTFSTGVAYTPERMGGHTLPSVINIQSDGEKIAGLAVQKSGNFLFSSKTGLNEIKVINKTTGAIVNTITTLNAPGSMVVDSNEHLWVEVLNGTTPELRQYSVHSTTGALTYIKTAGVTLSAPRGIGASRDRTTIAVVDGGASQQVKTFTASTGTAGWTLGQAGGYTTDATVTNNKFMFESIAGQGSRDFAGITFLADGSFWLTDIGNARVLHFDASRNFIDQVQYIDASYFTSVDQNDATRVFSDFLEFEIDYSKSLSPTNGSWVLKRNWQGVRPAGFSSDQYKRFYPQTLSNGRTYALLTRDSDNKLQLFEMTPDNDFSNTGVITTATSASLQPDGSIRQQTTPTIGGSGNVVGGTITWTSRAIDYFDSSHIPHYLPPTTLATTVVQATDPGWYDSNYNRPGVQTTGDILVAFEGPDASNGHGYGYHLGGVRLGGTDWLWRTSMATFDDYKGDYPRDGSFDIGNDVKYAGNAAVTLDDNIIWGYNGEFYKNGQTNMFTHYNESGLLINTFGTVGQEVIGTEPYPAGFAGNSFSPWLVKAANGEVYLYHNDESQHAGVHRWHIDGLDSVEEHLSDITLDTSTAAQPGLRGEYFDTDDLHSRNTVTVRTDSNVNFNWSTAIPSGTAITSASTYSVRWEGFIDPLYTERYTFIANGDGAGTAKVWINGVRVTDRNTALDGTSAAATSNRTTVSGSEPYRAFDGSATTKWKVNNSTGWLRYTYPSGDTRVLSQYSITSANDQATADPRDWELQASNDGTTWTTINTQTAQTFASRGMTKTYAVTNYAAFKQYRLNITANNGHATLTQVADLSLDERAVRLEAGRPASITVEYSHDTGNANASLSWASSSQAVQVVPNNRLSWIDWLHPTGAPNGPINLLEDFKFNDFLEDNRYGWQRSDETGWIAKRFSVDTSKYSNSRTNPDLSISFTKNTISSFDYLTRDLGTPNSATTKWELIGEIAYPSTHANAANGANGQVMELLDDTGKVIASFQPIRNSAGTGAYMRGNGANLLTMTDSEFLDYTKPYRPFSIIADNGTFTFNYGSYSASTSTPGEVGANWNRPTTLRFRYFFTQAGATFNRNMAIKTLTFQAHQPPTAPSALSATPASSSQITLAWTDNSNNQASFVLDRATDSGFTTGLTTTTLGANVTSYSSTGLSSNTTYYYRVRAINPGGVSANSSTANATTSSSYLLYAKFNGTGTGTGGISDAIEYGGTAAFTAGVSGNTQTIQSSPSMDGNFLRGDIANASGTKARMTITPASAANSWAALTTKPGSQWLINGGFDFFWRPNSSAIQQRALDFSNSSSGGWRLVFLITGASMRTELIPASGTPAAGKWLESKNTTSLEDQIYHLGVTFNTNPSTGVVTVRYFKKAGTDAIDTSSSSADKIHEGTFQPDESYVTTTFSSGAFDINTLATTGGSTLQNDMDDFRLWSTDPTSFPELGGGSGLMRMSSPDAITTSRQAPPASNASGTATAFKKQRLSSLFSKSADSLASRLLDGNRADQSPGNSTLFLQQRTPSLFGKSVTRLGLNLFDEDGIQRSVLN